jgi:Family of unknown function (DUF5681)
MDGMAHDALRDARGRFIPGRSGNPAGKKPGTRNRASVLREALHDGEDVAAARIVIDKALGGHAVTVCFVVDRLMPRPRGRTIELDLPAGASARDVVVAYDATVAAMASGEITPDEALMVARVLDGRLTALQAAAREQATQREVAREAPSPFAGPSTKPHEGWGEGVRAGRGAPRQLPPHPPIAGAPSTYAQNGPALSRKRRGSSPAFDLHFAGDGAIISAR